MTSRAAVLALCLAVVTAAPAVARFSDAPAATAAFTTDRLDSPTGLAGSGPIALTVTLTWSPVADAYAEGYHLYRSTTSGSGYSFVKSITPRTANSTTDTPLVPGAYFYVLRTYAGGWTSLPSNEVAVLVL